MKLSIHNIVEWMERNNYHFGCDLMSDRALFSGVSLCEEPVFSEDILYVCDFTDDILHTRSVYIVTMYGDVITISDAEPQELFNSLINMFDMYNRWETRLLQCVLEHRSLEELGSIGGEVFQGPALLFCMDGFPRPLNRSYASDCTPLWKELVESPDPPDIVLQRHNGGEAIFPEMPHPCLIPLDNGDHILYAPIYWREKVVSAVVVLPFTRQFRPGDIAPLECLTNAVNRHMLLRQNVYFHSDYFEAYVRAIIGERDMCLARESIIRERNAWCFKNETTLIFVAPFAGFDIIETGVLRRLQNMAPPHTHYFVMKQDCLGVLTESERVNEELIDGIVSAFGIPVCVGISSPFRGLDGLRDRYLSAMIAMRYCSTSHLVYREQDVICDQLRNELSSDAEIRTYVHPSLRILQAYDRRDGTHLLETLRQFVFHECNYTESAKALHISRNTMIHLITRIRELTALDFDDYDQIKAVLFSFLIYDDAKVY